MEFESHLSTTGRLELPRSVIDLLLERTANDGRLMCTLGRTPTELELMSADQFRARIAAIERLPQENREAFFAAVVGLAHEIQIDRGTCFIELPRPLRLRLRLQRANRVTVVVLEEESSRHILLR